MDRELINIFQELEQAFLSENRQGGNEAAAALSQARSQALTVADTGTAPRSLVQQAAHQSQSLPIASDILKCSPYFYWEKWAEDVLEEEVSANLYTTELIGPEGLLPHDRVRIGLLVSAANTDYPLSSHSGEETYLVISGAAEWVVEGQPYKTMPPGSLVHHPSWVPHGRRTVNEAFLGAWSWSGDLDLDSFRLNNQSGSS